jgi:hypothetical protein
MKRDTEQKITVEDLLRLKRAERPPPEFWSTFESQIRAKQLSAIVSKRPWWDGFSRVFAVVNRHQLSLGGAAAVALAFAGFRYMGGHSEPVRAPQVATTVRPAAVVATVAAVPARVAPQIAPVAAPREEVELAAEETAPAPRPVVTETESHITQAPAVAPGDGSTRAPFADGIAITLADFREPASDYAKPAVFGSDRDFETSIAPAHQPVSEPLATMDPAAERRARLLAPAFPSYASGNARALASDWMKQRASSDDRMYESMDRGSNDDRMLVGFRF